MRGRGMLIVLAALGTLLAGEDRPWRLGIGGDTMLARGVERVTLPSGDPTAAFGDMAPFLRELDLLFVNLECQIADVGRPLDKGERKPWYFRADPRMVESLVASGVDAVTVANNHGMDYGPDALLQTLALVRENGIVIVGGGENAAAAAAPGVAEAGGRRVAFVGFNATYPLMGAGGSTAGLNALRYQEPDHFLAAADAALDRARKVADIVVFTVHWGPNYRIGPDPLQRRLARAILDLGYAAFIGHSAHQFLGVEVHAGKPIIHDAGNFVVDFAVKAWNDRNLLFVLHFVGDRAVKLEGIPIHRRGAVTSFATGDTAREICGHFVELSAALGTEATIADGDRVVVSLEP